MQSIYQAANIADAHLIRQLLEREGIPAHVLGEYLQGGVGELPVDTQIRVMVADEDVERARNLVVEWEAGEVADPEALEALSAQIGTETGSEAVRPAPDRAPPRAADPTSRAGDGRGMLWFLCGAAAGAALCWAALRGPTHAQGVDYDGDGKLDEQWFYSGERLLRIESDRNRDLKTDLIVHYDGSGQADRAEYDHDFDGRYETRERYLRNELAERIVDRDGDGVNEYSAEHMLGVPFREEWRNATGTVIKRIQYERGIPISGEIDRDGDGQIDHARRYDPRGEILGEQPVGTQSTEEAQSAGG